MCDTFHLRLTGLARGLDDPAYAYSWYEEPEAAGDFRSEDPAGVTSHL